MRRTAHCLILHCWPRWPRMPQATIDTPARSGAAACLSGGARGGTSSIGEPGQRRSAVATQAHGADTLWAAAAAMGASSRGCAHRNGTACCPVCSLIRSFCAAGGAAAFHRRNPLAWHVPGMPVAACLDAARQERLRGLAAHFLHREAITR